MTDPLAETCGPPVPEQRPGASSPHGCRLSPQQHLQLRLPLPLQLQLLLQDLLHPGHVRQGLLPAGQVRTLVLLLLLQERLQDALVCLLEEGSGSTVGTGRSIWQPRLHSCQPFSSEARHRQQTRVMLPDVLLFSTHRWEDVGWFKMIPQRPRSCSLPPHACPYPQTHLVAQLFRSQFESNSKNTDYGDMCTKCSLQPSRKRENLGTTQTPTGRKELLCTSRQQDAVARGNSAGLEMGETSSGGSHMALPPKL